MYVNGVGLNKFKSVLLNLNISAITVDLFC